MFGSDEHDLHERVFTTAEAIASFLEWRRGLRIKDKHIVYTDIFHRSENLLTAFCTKTNSHKNLQCSQVQYHLFFNDMHKKIVSMNEQQENFKIGMGICKALFVSSGSVDALVTWTVLGLLLTVSFMF